MNDVSKPNKQLRRINALLETGEQFLNDKYQEILYTMTPNVNEMNADRTLSLLEMSLPVARVLAEGGTINEAFGVLDKQPCTSEEYMLIVNNVAKLSDQGVRFTSMAESHRAGLEAALAAAKSDKKLIYMQGPNANQISVATDLDGWKQISPKELGMELYDRATGKTSTSMDIRIEGHMVDVDTDKVFSNPYLAIEASDCKSMRTFDNGSFYLEFSGAILTSEPLTREQLQEAKRVARIEQSVQYDGNVTQKKWVEL